MATISISVIPDSSLGVQPVTRTLTLADPTDLLVLIEVYQSLYADQWKKADLHGIIVPFIPEPEQVLIAIADGIFHGVQDNVEREALAAKKASVTVSFAGATIS